jgi:hypothetical protein
MKNITIQFILQKTSSNYEDIHSTGVYKIFHIYDPSILYIGSAASSTKWREGFKQRWVCHLKELKNNRHHSPFLQRIVNKYGIEGLRFEILEKCKPDECLQKEQFWLDKLRPFGKNGYNTCLKAGNTLGYKFPEDKKSRRISIVQYSLDGDFIKQWDSLNQASRDLNINVSSIKDCCKKRFKQIKGYVFRYLGDDLDIPAKETLRLPMIIECFCKDKLMHIGKFSEIIEVVPDKKLAIYKSIKDGNFTKKGWKYCKKLN